MHMSNFVLAHVKLKDTVGITKASAICFCVVCYILILSR